MRWIEDLFEHLTAVIKNLVEPMADRQSMQHQSEQASWKSVVHFIYFLCTTVNRAETVLVVPKPIGAMTLLVDEKARWPYLCDLRHPGHGDAGQGSNTIGDNQSGVDGFGQR
jgi:hypothetical protein